VLAAKSRTNFRRRQHACERQTTAESLELAAPTLGSVDRREQSYGFAATHRLGNALEADDRKTRPARKPDRIDAALRERRLEAIGKAGGNSNRPACGPREQPFGQSPLDYIAARRQPQTPSGQPGGDVGDDFAARADDKAHKIGSVADVAGH